MTDRKEYYKKYNDEHKEQKKQYMLEYYKLNRDEILAKQASSEKKLKWLKEKVKCDVCGAMVCNPVMSRHKKTQKCKNNAINKNDNDNTTESTKCSDNGSVSSDD